MVSELVTVNEAVAVWLWSAVANAVSNTVPPTMPGTTAGPGTIKFIGALGAEWKLLGLQLTEGFTVMQVACQSTPKFAGSPVTLAAKDTIAPEGADCGGGCVMVTPVTVEIMVTALEKALL